MARELLEAGADKDAVARNGSTPLYLAICYHKVALVRLLLERGAKTEARSHDAGRAALHLAAETGQAAVVQLLLHYAAEINQRMDDTGASALHLAANNGHLKVVQLLIKKAADVNQPRSDNASRPLHFAARKGHTQVASELLRALAMPDSSATDGSTPLHVAANNGCFEILEELLKARAELANTTSDGCTALDLAHRRGHEALGRLLESAAKRRKGLDSRKPWELRSEPRFTRNARTKASKGPSKGLEQSLLRALEVANKALVPPKAECLECHLCETAYRALSRSEPLLHLALPGPSRGRGQRPLEATQAGRCHGVAFWASFEVTEDFHLSTGALPCLIDSLCPLFFCLSIHLSICLFVYLFICMFICLRCLYSLEHDDKKAYKSWSNRCRSLKEQGV